jgi:cytoskeletal protein CcmA (bactofilin family)
MKSAPRLTWLILSCFLFVGAFSRTAFADGSHDRTQFGHNISIAPGEEVADVTCFACSVRIRGHVAGDVTTFGGSIVVEDDGQIAGDTTSFAGDVRLDKGVKVAGDITVFGGRLQRDPEAVVNGDVTNFRGRGWVVLIFGLPLMLLGAFLALIFWLVRRLMRRPAMPMAA